MGSWIKSLDVKFQNAILLQPTQPTLANVFQLLEKIEMNMVEEHMVTLGFNKDNPRNSPTPLGQQSWSQPTKDVPPKVKRVEPNLGGVSTSYSGEQGGVN
jgi:hypothetical protein